MASGEQAGQITGKPPKKNPSGAEAQADPLYGLKPVPFAEAASPASNAARAAGSDVPATMGLTARLRNWKPGDRVRLRHSSGLRKVKEVLERMRVTGERKGVLAVLEVDGRIVWMKGVELEPEPEIIVVATSLEDMGESAGKDGG